MPKKIEWLQDLQDPQRAKELLVTLLQVILAILVGIIQVVSGLCHGLVIGGTSVILRLIASALHLPVDGELMNLIGGGIVAGGLLGSLFYPFLINGFRISKWLPFVGGKVVPGIPPWALFCLAGVFFFLTSAGVLLLPLLYVGILILRVLAGLSSGLLSALAASYVNKKVGSNGIVAALYNPCLVLGIYLTQTISTAFYHQVAWPILLAWPGLFGLVLVGLQLLSPIIDGLTAAIADLRPPVQPRAQQRVPLVFLWRNKAYRGSFILACLLQMSNQFTGINVWSLFAALFVDPTQVQFVGLGQLLGSAFMLVVIRFVKPKFNKVDKVVLVIALIVMSVCVGCAVYYLHTGGIPDWVVLLYSASFGAGPAFCWGYAAEALRELPEGLRDTAIGLSSAVNWTFNAYVTFLFSFELLLFGDGTYAQYAVTSLIFALIFGLVYLRPRRTSQPTNAT